MAKTVERIGLTLKPGWIRLSVWGLRRLRVFALPVPLAMQLHHELGEAISEAVVVPLKKGGKRAD